MRFTSQQMPPEFANVIERRFLSVDGETRLAALGTRGSFSTFWRDRLNLIVVFGDSKFQDFCRANARREGCPIPRLAFPGELNPFASALEMFGGPGVSRHLALVLNDPHPAIRFRPGASILFAKMKFATITQPVVSTGEMHPFFVATLNEDLSLSQAAAHLETTLIWAFEPVIKRVPLDAVD